MVLADAEVGPVVRSSRAILWEAVLDEEPALRECMTAKTGWKRQELPVKIEGIFTSLSNRIHLDYQRSDNQVDIVEGVLAHKECGALECVCDHLHVAWSRETAWS